ncbi:MAG: undecaprenyldiphospho-muramoylpentapeptide beta-N-acetylglucosaminyltransferase [Fusobacteria bacterium]|nr:undecaprenyldiphospho-muramoylpentapeptide beta-N-acetylglucosaminyltransferase [Fusobacteriota bacterium]
MKKVLMAAGGTGGHIYPAISVAERLREKEVEVIFAGSKYRMEKKIVPQHKFPFFAFPIARLSNVKGIFLFLISIINAIRLLKRERVDIVFGWGNYTTVPFLVAALICRKPFYLHEQNVELGSANKFFYRYSSKIFLSFNKTFDTLPIKYSEKYQVVGNPIRKEFYDVTYSKCRAMLNIAPEEKMILVFGGSLGAKKLNDAIIEKLKEIENSGVKFYFVVGRQLYDEVKKKIPSEIKNVKIFDYISEMYSYMAAADLIMCRSGASTVSELIVLEKPSILIPHDFVGQVQNAEVVAKVGAAYIYRNSEVKNGIDKALSIVQNPSLLRMMEKNLRELQHENVVGKIAENLNIWRT